MWISFWRALNLPVIGGGGPAFKPGPLSLNLRFQNPECPQTWGRWVRRRQNFLLPPCQRFDVGAGLAADAPVATFHFLDNHHGERAHVLAFEIGGHRLKGELHAYSQPILQSNSGGRIPFSI